MNSVETEPVENEELKFQSLYYWDRLFGSRLPVFFLLTACCVVFFLSIFITKFSHPLADDFGRAALVGEIGFLESIKYEYINWSGRWLGTGLAYASASAFDLVKVYPFLLIVLSCFTIIGLFFYIDIIFGTKPISFKTTFYSLLIFSIYWCGLPSTGECFYWYTGVLENNLGINLSIFLFWGLLWSQGYKGRLRKLCRTGLLALAFAIPGIHELFGTLLCFLLLIITGFSFHFDTKGRHYFLLISIVAIIGLVFVILAPGNSIRASYFDDRFKIWIAFPLAAKEALKSVSFWVFDVRLLSATLLLYLLLSLRIIVPKPHFNIVLEQRIMVLAIWLVILSIGFLGPYYATGRFMPLRTKSGLYYIFIIGWFLNVSLFVKPIADRGLQLCRADATLINAVIVIISMSILYSGNSFTAISDFGLGKFQSYDREMNSRHEIMRGYKENQNLAVEVKPLALWPRSFMPNSDIKTSKENWINLSYARYYKVKSVCLVD